MENIEVYWATANQIIAMLNIVVEGWLFYRFVKPFMKKNAPCVGLCYCAVMMLLYCVPQEIASPYLLGILVTGVAMCLLERRNIKQKVFLATSMYLFRWVVYGVTLVLRDIMFAVFINTPQMLAKPLKQVAVYVVVELVYYGVAITAMYLAIKLIHRVYVNKKEDMSSKELLLLFATLLTVMIGYFTFSFFSDVYVNDMGAYIWNVHPEYTLLRVVYQIVSFAAILIAIAIYQRLKERQREEKENMLLAEQIENTRQHICEVEKLYGDIRAIKHDMGNHITVLENLFLKNETDAFEKYMIELKTSLGESMSQIRTGNPVTDVILTQKQKEAAENGIDFRCSFVYPTDTNINAFDISVILNNAIANAFEGVAGCINPYVSVSAYRRKNAYMLEVTNYTEKQVEIDAETGLPETTKKDNGSHGYGLVNIRKVAGRYFGDIAIDQEDNRFTLTVMLMVE